VDYAGERGVRLIVENCVMEGWHPDGYPGNLAYSPELWDWVTGLGFGLNWDPSHLTWIGIDPLETILPFAEHIVHAQAKDLELFPAKRDQYGFFGKVDKGDDPWDMGWWRFRVPGRGVVDWPHVVDRLYEAGFDGTLSVEHEDPLWGGTDDKVLEGLRIAHRTLRPLIAQE
jgi:sugar phosphate isomerase/epimerase